MALGYTLAEDFALPMEPYFQAGDGILAARIVALVELGMLEGRGCLMDIRQSELRLRHHAHPTGPDTP